MTNNMVYVAMITRTKTPCFLTKEASEIADRTWRCTGCAAPKPDVKSIDAHLESKPRDKPLNFAYGDAVTVIYLPFLQKFPQALVDRDLYVGRVYGPKGKLIPDWATIHGRKRLIIRGTDDAGVRRCDECGRDVYFSLDGLFLYPQPPDDVAIFEVAGGAGLIVREELFNTIDIGKWHTLRILRLPVIDPPPDGLGELPNA